MITETELKQTVLDITEKYTGISIWNIQYIAGHMPPMAKKLFLFLIF
jgi:hypothetical protein